MAIAAALQVLRIFGCVHVSADAVLLAVHLIMS